MMHYILNLIASLKKKKNIIFFHLFSFLNKIMNYFIKLYIILTTTLTIKTNPFPKTPSTISVVRIGASTDFSVLDQ